MQTYCTVVKRYQLSCFQLRSMTANAHPHQSKLEKLSSFLAYSFIIFSRFFPFLRRFAVGIFSHLLHFRFSIGFSLVPSCRFKMPMGTNDYSSLNRAQLTFDYLHTNSTTHEFLFGALAELVDNSRDAGAETLQVYSVPNSELRGGNLLYFLDDGCGMNPDEAINVVSFGKSMKRSEIAVGQYGNGLKSGSMRVGNDFILFTKKDDAYTCLFLSRTFHEMEGIKEVIVPIPSFDVDTREPLLIGGKTKSKHDLELRLILRYSPFRTVESLMSEFDKIESKTGTAVILYNLKLLDNGRSELNVTSCADDILLAYSGVDRETHESLQPEWRSFREYVSILYYDPRMKVYLQGKKVRTKRLVNMLYKPRIYKFISNRFKTRSEQELNKALEESQQVNSKLRELESRYFDLEQRLNQAGKLKHSERTELCQQQMALEIIRSECAEKKRNVEAKERQLKEPKMISLIFGLNLNARTLDGMFVYNCSRLIRMYEKVGKQTDGMLEYGGVVGIVNIPYLVLEPTHNKQNFADKQEYRILLKVMKEHMEQYWRDVGLDKIDIVKFWTDFGYTEKTMDEPPSDELKYMRKRMMTLGTCLQCDKCLKWRMVAFSSKDVGKDYPDGWTCSMNMDPLQNKCSLPERPTQIEEAFLRKNVKTKDVQKQELEDKMEKLKKDYVKVSNRVSSRRDADALLSGNNGRKAAGKQKSRTQGKRLNYNEDCDYVTKSNSNNSNNNNLNGSRTSARQKRNNSVRSSETTMIVTKPLSFAGSKRSRRRCVIQSSSDEANADHQDEFEPPPRKFSPLSPVKCNGTTEWLQLDGDISTGTKLTVFVHSQGTWQPALIHGIDHDNNRLRVEFEPVSSGSPTMHSKWIPFSERGVTWDIHVDSEAVEQRISSQTNISADVVPCCNKATQETLVDKYKSVLMYLAPESCTTLRQEIANMDIDRLAEMSTEGMIATHERALRQKMRSADRQLAQVHTDLNTLRDHISILLRVIDKKFLSTRPTPQEIRESIDRMIESLERKPSTFPTLSPYEMQPFDSDVIDNS